MTELILFTIIAMQLGYSIYKDVSYKQERERMILKIMSKNTEEYTEAVKEIEEELPKNAKEEKNKSDYHEISEVPLEKLMKAEDNL